MSKETVENKSEVVRCYTVTDVTSHLAKNNQSESVMSKINSFLKKQNKKYTMGRQDQIDCQMMLTNLAQLKSLSVGNQSKEAFADFFESTLVGAFLRYRASKKKTWGTAQIILLPIATTVTSWLSGAIVAWLSAAEGTLVGAPQVVIMAACAIAVLASGYTQWHNMKNDKETWVRHSVCYNRLNLLLQRFILSKQSDEDYESLVENTYAILEQNLDQFTMNLSTNGLAERPEVDS